MLVRRRSQNKAAAFLETASHCPLDRTPPGKPAATAFICSAASHRAGKQKNGCPDPWTSTQRARVPRPESCYLISHEHDQRSLGQAVGKLGTWKKSPGASVLQRGGTLGHCMGSAGLSPPALFVSSCSDGKCTKQPADLT